MAVAIALLVATGSWGIACTTAGPDRLFGPRIELTRNAQRWRAQGLAAYSLVERRVCFCIERGPVRVVVRGGVVDSVVVIAGGAVLTSAEAAQYRSVGGLFAVIADALDRDAASLQVTYHPTLGYPTSISIDYSAQVADEEVQYLVSDLTPAALPKR